MRIAGPASTPEKSSRVQSPRTCPSSSPQDFEFVINLKTAKRLGLTIPDNLLALADKVIE
jgi:putative ABC transport system substrate-binding protein